MDGYQQATQGQASELCRARLGIAKAIALNELARLPNGAPNLNGTPQVAAAIRAHADRIKDVDMPGGTFVIKPRYAPDGNLKGWLKTALALSKASKAAGPATAWSRPRTCTASSTGRTTSRSS